MAVPDHAFVHLRVHTPYSLLQGAIQIPRLVDLCVKHDMPAMAVTDTGNMFGVLEFSQTCLAQGVQPVIGTLIALRFASDEPLRDEERAEHIVLFAQDEAGYANLMALSSRSHLASQSGEIPSISLDDLDGRTDGLICLTGGAYGPLGAMVRKQKTGIAGSRLGTLQGLFDDRLYIEIQRHGLADEDRCEAAFLDLAREHGVPIVATNDVMFADKSMFGAHEVLLGIAGQDSAVRRERSTVESCFKSPDEMSALFRDLPEAIMNTGMIAQRCACTSPTRDPILPAFSLPTGVSEADKLRALARDGLMERLSRTGQSGDPSNADEETLSAYRSRLEYELDVINKMGFAGYFLIVADIIRWAKNEGIPVGPGRGSGAGSIVAWSLTITDLDPLRFGLLFERFLNPERVSMPDFDIDFCQNRREEVIAYIRERYGHDNVAQIITFGTLQARGVVRDVGRVMKVPHHKVDSFAKQIPNAVPQVPLDEILQHDERVREATQDPQIRQLVDVAVQLEGLQRHASTHAAGLVIGDRPLQELVPLYRDPRSDLPVSQFHMKAVEKAGLVKFDFLGLTTLTILETAVKFVREGGAAIDLQRIPLDDSDTYTLLSQADTIGVFQLEGQGMRDALRQLLPDSIEDIIALVSLYRPGPMDNIPQYCNRKHGREEVDCLHPLLKPVLEETYGVIIYQEQVMQIAQVLADYSLGEADLLRRAMGKKIKEEMAAQRDRFVSGAVAKGVEEAKASEIFALVDKFAGYGFNKSHAAAYAVVAYQTAYMKTHYPVEFLAASMNFAFDKPDDVSVFRGELNRIGSSLLGPSINASDVSFSIEHAPDGKAVRYGLAAIRHVGAGAVSCIVTEREKNGPYKDLSDLLSRVDLAQVGRKALEALASAGAFDCLESNRARIFGNAEYLVRYSSNLAQERTSGLRSLFADEANDQIMMPSLKDVGTWNRFDELKAEAESIGFYFTAHPLDSFGKGLETRRVVTHQQAIANTESGESSFRLAGVVVSARERRNASGSRFAFLTLSDQAGQFEVVLFPEILEAARPLLESGQSLFMEVDSRRDDNGVVKFSARQVEALADTVARDCVKFNVHVDGKLTPDGLFQVLSEAGAGNGRVVLNYASGDGRFIDVVLPGRYMLSPMLGARIRVIDGVHGLEEVTTNQRSGSA